MSAIDMVFRLRVRNATNTADALTITSLRGGTNPWLSSAPAGDGQEFDPITGKSVCGAYSGRIADGITSGTDRIVTSQLEDATKRQQLMDRRAFVEWSADGVTWTGGADGGVLIAGFLTQLRLSSGAEYEYTVSDPTRAEHDYTAFKPQDAVLVVAAPGALAGATTLPCEPLTIGIPAGAQVICNGKQVFVSATASAGATSLTVTALLNAMNAGDIGGYQESIASFLARWPNRGCIFGGPVRGGFLGQPDRGGWEMTVDSRSGDTDFSQVTLLKFVAGYGPPAFERSTDVKRCATAANSKSDPLYRGGGQLYDEVTTFEQARTAAFWPGVVIEIIGHGCYQPDSGFARTRGDVYRHLVKDHGGPSGVFIMTPALGTANVPAAGTAVRVRAFTADASEISPIYYSAHPVDWMATLWSEAGLPYNAAALETVRGAIGADRRYAARITAPQNLGDWLEKNIYGPFGIGVRPNDAGELEAFAARIQYAAVPTTEITAADVWTDESGATPEIFAIGQSTAIKTVTVEHQRLVLTQDASDDTSPDGFVVQSERFERTNADPGAVGNQDASYALSGMVHGKESVAPDVASFVDALAYELFDRYGRAIITGEVDGLRGGSTDGVALGAEVLNVLPTLPNHNKRLADDPSVSGRAMQIVRTTWTPRGPRLKLADSGPNAQPYPTVPTVTIAASATFPRTVADLTVTNAAALNTDGAGLRVQTAVTTGSAPAASDYTDVAAFPGGLIPTGAIALPAVTAARTVYVRAAATKAGVTRPSTWSTPVHVTLGAVAPVTGLTAAADASDGSRAFVRWTAVDDDAAVVDVYVRLATEDASVAVRTAVLLARSDRYTVEGLAPNTAYTIGVQTRDPQTGDVAAMIDVAVTTSATVRVLDTPTDPNGFSGSQDRSFGLPQADGLYGLAVAATEFPGFTEFSEQVETGVGTDSYGDPTTIARVPNVQGDWTLCQRLAPNDGLRRQLTARHVRDSATPSEYTDPVVATPWTAKPLGPFAATVAQESLIGFDWFDSDDGRERTYSWTRGARVAVVLVYTKTLIAPLTGDTWDMTGVAPAAALSDGTDAFTIAKPPDGSQTFLQFEPRTDDLTAGPVRRAELNPAPSALAVKIRRTVSNDRADLEIEVLGGPSDWPVVLQIFEDDPDGPPLLTATLTQNTTLTKDDFPALGGRLLPQRALQHWWAEVENVAGRITWDTAAADRDALPSASVTLLDYRATPVFFVPIDDDTDAVRFTTPAGIKTITTPPGTAHATFTIGDPLDDLTTENALKVDETRTGYRVEVLGGGTWLTVWGTASGEGALHGQPSNPPTLEVVDAGISTNGDTASPTFVIASPVGERVGLFLKLADGLSAPVYSRTSGSGSTAMGFVASGTTIGPTDYFSAGGAAVQKLNAIPLTHGKLTRIYLQVIGEDSGVESAWIPVTLDPGVTNIDVQVVDNDTLDVIVSEPAAFIHATNRVKFYVTGADGTRTLTSPSSSPGGIVGTYSITVGLDEKHDTVVEPIVYFADGSSKVLGAWSFDPDLDADVKATVSYNGQTATVTARFDTDTVIGSHGRYRIDGGSWVTFTVGSDLLGSFNVTASESAVQVVEIQGQNADGVWGPTETVKIDVYVSPGPSLSVSSVVTASDVTITWSGTTVTRRVDGGSFTTPPASPYTVSRDSSEHRHTFQAIRAGETKTTEVVIPALPPSGGGGSLFSFVAIIAVDPATVDTMRVSWVYGGASAATFDVYVDDGGGAFAYNGTTASGASSYDFADFDDLTNNPSAPTKTVRAYVVASSGGVSDITSTVVHHA